MSCPQSFETYLVPSGLGSTALPWINFQGGPYGGGYGGTLVRDQYLIQRDYGRQASLAFAGYYYPRQSCQRRFRDSFGCRPPQQCTEAQKEKWDEKNNSIGPHGGCESDCQCKGDRVCDMRFGTWGYCKDKSM